MRIIEFCIILNFCRTKPLIDLNRDVQISMVVQTRTEYSKKHSKTLSKQNLYDSSIGKSNIDLTQNEVCNYVHMQQLY